MLTAVKTVHERRGLPAHVGFIRSAALATIVFLIASLLSAAANTTPTTNSLTEDLIGKWRYTESYSGIGGTAVIRRLPSGTIYAIAHEERAGRRRRAVEFWLYPNGRSVNKIYVDSSAVLAGTWSRNGNAIKRNYGLLQTTLRRKNKNKWVDAVRDNEGNLLTVVTLTRIGSSR